MRALTTAPLLITAPALPHRCFLLTYASMNLNCFFLDYLKDPTWRPRWKYFHWSSGLAGFVLCVTVQFLIDWIYAIIAWVLWLVLLIFIVRTTASVDHHSPRRQMLTTAPALPHRCAPLPPWTMAQQYTACAFAWLSSRSSRSTWPRIRTIIGSRSCSCSIPCRCLFNPALYL